MNYTTLVFAPPDTKHAEQNIFKRIKLMKTTVLK